MGKRITVRFSDAEYSILENAAEDSGDTVAGVVREACSQRQQRVCLLEIEERLSKRIEGVSDVFTALMQQIRRS